MRPDWSFGESCSASKRRLVTGTLPPYCTARPEYQTDDRYEEYRAVLEGVINQLWRVLKAPAVGRDREFLLSPGGNYNCRSSNGTAAKAERPTAVPAPAAARATPKASDNGAPIETVIEAVGVLKGLVGKLGKWNVVKLVEAL